MGVNAALALKAAHAMISGHAGEQIFAPDCRSWHNWDEVEVRTVPDVLDASTAALTVMPDLRLEQVVAMPITDELSVLRYRVCGTFPDGHAMNAPGVLFVHVCDGLVVRTEEFLDSAQTLALFAQHAGT